MLVGRINEEYEMAQKRAQRLFKEYIMRFLDKWCPKGIAGMKAEWKRGNKAYFLSIKIETIGGSDDNKR